MNRATSTVILVLVLIHLVFVVRDAAGWFTGSPGVGLGIDLLFLAGTLAVGAAVIERIVGRERQSPALGIGIALLLSAILVMEVARP